MIYSKGKKRERGVKRIQASRLLELEGKEKIILVPKGGGCKSQPLSIKIGYTANTIKYTWVQE